MIRLAPDTDLSAVVRALIDLSFLSAAELSRRTGFADSQISKWRRGVVVPTLPVLLRLADAAGYELALAPVRESSC